MDKVETQLLATRATHSVFILEEVLGLEASSPRYRSRTRWHDNWMTFWRWPCVHWLRFGTFADELPMVSTNLHNHRLVKCLVNGLPPDRCTSKDSICVSHKIFCRPAFDSEEISVTPLRFHFVSPMLVRCELEHDLLRKNCQWDITPVARHVLIRCSSICLDLTSRQYFS